MKIRINNLEFRKSISIKKDKILYEIVKLENNPYFGKEEEYRKDGYIDSFGGDYLQKENKSIQKLCFMYPESSYVIAFIEKGKESWELRSVGERMLDLTPEEWVEFHQVYTLGQTKLNKNN